MDIYLSQLFTGLSVGSIPLLIALGLTFTFGQMGVINLAHGELIMAGAYTAYMVGGPVSASVSLLVPLPVAFALAGTMGLVLERVLIRRLYGRPLDTLLVTWGVSLLLQQLARDIFGAPNVQVKAPSFLEGSLKIGEVSLSYTRMFIIGLVLMCVFAIWVFMSKTVHGTR